MRLPNFFLSALVAVCAFSGLCSAETGGKASRKRIYVDGSSIAVCEGGFKVKTEKGVVTTKAVHSVRIAHTTTTVYYVLESEVIQPEQQG
jgi:ribosome-binding protein aMBF1 (putative translation factor)